MKREANLLYRSVAATQRLTAVMLSTTCRNKSTCFERFIFEPILEGSTL